MTAPDWTIPEPRPDVVDLLTWAMVLADVDPQARAMHEARHAWTTGVERRMAFDEAIATLSEEVTRKRAQSDQLDAAIRDEEGQP